MTEKDFDLFLQKSLEESVEKIYVSDDEKEAIYDHIQRKSKDNWVKKFLNYEICIPLKPLWIGAVVCFIGVFYLSIHTFQITPEEIAQSRITIVKLDKGGK